MGDVHEDLAHAHEMPEGDVIRILLEQHVRIKELFAQVEKTSGQERQDAFDDLRSLLAVHETAEEIVVRPLTQELAARGVADARNQEEEEATKVLQQLEKMEVDSTEFVNTIKDLKQSVVEHAEQEETEEFPAVLEKCTVEDRQDMGRKVLKAESSAPTHPHPTAAGSPGLQKAMGPFAAMMDRARDAIGS